MRKISFIFLMLFLTSCEVFVIGSNKKPKEVVDIDQKTSVGAAMLFTTELQLNNVPGAARLLSDNQKRLSASEQQEQYYN